LKVEERRVEELEELKNGGEVREAFSGGRSCDVAAGGASASANRSA